jgi:hypothetical protein
MPLLLVKFRIMLESYRSFSLEPAYYDPLFYRWLPNGKNDAIALPTGDSNTQLKVWFERRGSLKFGWLEFDYQGQEIDPGIMAAYAKLDAGPLRRLLELRGVSKEQLSLLFENKIGDKRYISLGKKIIKFIFPPVSNFLNILRTNYGQYWLPNIERWDSRQKSLGAYCQWHGLHWSRDGGETWEPLLPNESHVVMRERENSFGRFSEYLTQKDWQELKRLSKKQYEPPLSIFMLARACALRDQEEMRYAFTEGVIALEIVLSNYIRTQYIPKLRRRIVKDKGLTDFLEKRINGSSLDDRVKIVADWLNGVSIEEVQQCIDSIDLRNKIVHDGLNVHSSAKTAELLSG